MPVCAAVMSGGRGAASGRMEPGASPEGCRAILSTYQPAGDGPLGSGRPNQTASMGYCLQSAPNHEFPYTAVSVAFKKINC